MMSIGGVLILVNGRWFGGHAIHDDFTISIEGSTMKWWREMTWRLIQ